MAREINAIRRVSSLAEHQTILHDNLSPWILKAAAVTFIPLCPCPTSRLLPVNESHGIMKSDFVIVDARFRRTFIVFCIDVI